MRLRLVAALLALAPAVAAAQVPASAFEVAAPAPAGFDRAAAQRSTLEHLQNLIRLDTQNPPGNELLTAQYFDSVFRAIPGVETHVIPAGEGRANFVARLRATRPTKRPVLVMGHMDVVGADTAKWDTDPFEPTVRGDYLYGRGAIDDKGMLAAATTAFQLLAQRRDQLDRDVVFLGTAGEEGGPDVGADLVLAEHRALLGDPEFALNEGGRVRLADGRVRSVNIQTTEKIYYEVVCRATGPSGHGSVPLPDNALAALSRAAARLHEWRAPVQLNETTRLYFTRLATIEPDSAIAAAMRRLVAPGATPAEIEAAAAVLSRDPLHNAVLRTAQALTLIDGGFRANVIPSEGTATFNVRIVPTDDIQAVVRRMNEVAAEPSVRCALEGAVRPVPPVSPVGSALFRAMERAANAMAPGAVVIPFMSTGATDGAVLRREGIPTYGILPMPLLMEDEIRMHGDNERVPVRALGWAAEYLYRTLGGVASREMAK